MFTLVFMPYLPALFRKPKRKDKKYQKQQQHVIETSGHSFTRKVIGRSPPWGNASFWT
jgi:hypothetical protein